MTQQVLDIALQKWSKSCYKRVYGLKMVKKGLKVVQKGSKSGKKMTKSGLDMVQKCPKKDS
mgnify:CR=1 FL=1